MWYRYICGIDIYLQTSNDMYTACGEDIYMWCRFVCGVYIYILVSKHICGVDIYKWHEYI